MKLGAVTNVSAAAMAAALVAGCANSGFDLSTASVTPAPVVVAQKADPVCAALANQINTLRSDASIGKLEKAAAGKTVKVEVKRTALQKQAELNKAYGNFQTRCGPALPNQVAVQQPVSPPPAPPAAKTASATSNSSAGSISSSPMTMDAN